MIPVGIIFATGDPGSSVAESVRTRSDGDRRGAATSGIWDKLASVPVEDIPFRVDRPRVAFRRHRDLGRDVGLHFDRRAAGLHLVYVIIPVGMRVASGGPRGSVRQPARVRSNTN